MLIKPLEEFTLPDDSVLRTKHPVIFGREDKQTALDSKHLGGIERCHSLRIRHAKVTFAVNYHDRSVPILHKEMRRMSE